VRDGDRLVVPRTGDGVRVFGAVARPGFLPFSPGRTPDDYVTEAGGLTDDASGVFVVEAGTGRLAPAAGQPIGLGDAVFASREAIAYTPETAQVALQRENIRIQERREELEVAREERQSRYQLVQTIVMAVQGLATAVSLYFAIANN